MDIDLEELVDLCLSKLPDNTDGEAAGGGAGSGGGLMVDLTAQLGQSLLEQNEELANELATANETIAQLRYELSTKNQLLEFYADDFEAENESNSSPQSPHHRCSNQSPSTSNNFNQSNSHSGRQRDDWQILQDQINQLETENMKLRSEASRRTMDIEAEERKEFLLIHDCAKQLIEANLQLINLQEELARRAEDNVHQQEEITNLSRQLVDLKRKVHDLNQENEGLYSALDLAHECQNVLSTELIEVRDKYDVLMSAFKELQEEMKRKTEINLSNWPPTGSYMPLCDSLAAELEESLDSFGYDSEFSSLNQSITHRKDLDDSRSHSPDSVLGGSNETTTKSTDKSTNNNNKYLNNNNNSNPNGISNPSYNSFNRTYLFSNKLKIVKPLEGSATLSRWQQMAHSPNLGAILENTSGVQNRVIAKVRYDLNHHKAVRAATSTVTTATTVTQTSPSSPTSTTTTEAAVAVTSETKK